MPGISLPLRSMASQDANRSLNGRACTRVESGLQSCAEAVCIAGGYGVIDIEFAFDVLRGLAPTTIQDRASSHTGDAPVLIINTGGELVYRPFSVLASKKLHTTLAIAMRLATSRIATLALLKRHCFALLSYCSSESSSSSDSIVIGSLKYGSIHSSESSASCQSGITPLVYRSGSLRVHRQPVGQIGVIAMHDGPVSVVIAS